MQKIVNHPFWQTHALLVGRILVGALFLYSGFTKLQGIDGTAEVIGGAGFPLPLFLAWAVAIFEVVVGALIVLGGRYFRKAVLSLAVFVFVVSWLFHGPNTWSDVNPMPFVAFLKNMAIVGGLLFMLAHGAGNTWTLGSKR